MTSRILTPLDGSPFAEQALPYAAQVARRSGSELLLVQVVPPIVDVVSVGGATSWQAWTDLTAAAEAYLQRVSEWLEAQGLQVRTIVVGGSPGEALLEQAQDPAVRLIVLATHSRSGPARWVLGSVAERLVREAPQPVLLLTPSALAAGSPERLRQGVLVPTDGSEGSERIFPEALRFARLMQAPICLVQAVSPATIYAQEVRALFDRVHPLDLQQRAVMAVLTALQPITAAWRQEGVEADVAAEIGDPVDVIERVAQRRRAGWIAMASHGRGGLSGMVLGSTALAVLHRASLPVLILGARAAQTDRLPTDTAAIAANDASAAPVSEPLAAATRS